MKLTNYTEVPDALLREMIRFCCPSGVAGYDITFKNSGDGFLTGWCYHSGTAYHQRDGKCPPLITISVPKWFGPDPKPRRKQWKGVQGRNPRRILCAQRQGQMGYMTRETFSQHEELVHIIAHEMRHLWQKRVPKGRRVWGGRGRYSERDADAYGIRLTRAWRRTTKSPTPFSGVRLKLSACNKSFRNRCKAG